MSPPNRDECRILTPQVSLDSTRFFPNATYFHTCILTNIGRFSYRRVNRKSTKARKRIRDARNHRRVPVDVQTLRWRAISRDGDDDWRRLPRASERYISRSRRISVVAFNVFNFATFRAVTPVTHLLSSTFGCTREHSSLPPRRTPTEWWFVEKRKDGYSCEIEIPMRFRGKSASEMRTFEEDYSRCPRGILL